MGMFRTPLIADLREDGSTFYTFSSAMEDIGLNINERNNKVFLSNYVLLNLPDMYFAHDSNTMNADSTNYIKLDEFFYKNKTTGKYTSATMRDKLKETPDKWFPVLMQNYLMNMETTLRNQGSYDHSSSLTVTERCFWKFLQHAGALSLIQDGDFFHEKWSNKGEIDSTVIKGFGAVSSSSQSSNSYNINNETYIMVPSSYGQMKYLMESTSDNNMSISSVYAPAVASSMEGHIGETGDFMSPLFDSSTETYTVGKRDCVGMVFDNVKLQTKLAPDSDTAISYDDLAGDKYSLSDEYKFNAILVYYTIYDSVGNDIATNLFGILVTKHPTPVINGMQYSFPSLIKKRSNIGSFGSSYSFRLNIQTASIYDSTNDKIIDCSTPTPATLTDFNSVVSALRNTVDILRNNAAVLTNVYNNNQSMRQLVDSAMTKVASIEQSLNDIIHGNVRDISADVIDTNELSTDKIVGDTAFVDESGKTIVNVDKTGMYVHGTFKADNIDMDGASLSSLSTQDISVGNSLKITDGANTIGPKTLECIGTLKDIVMDNPEKLYGPLSDTKCENEDSLQEILRVMAECTYLMKNEKGVLVTGLKDPAGLNDKMGAIIDARLEDPQTKFNEFGLDIKSAETISTRDILLLILRHLYNKEII